MAIMCDYCLKKRVEKDGELCIGCAEILRPKTVLDYLKGYLDTLENWENRFEVSERYLEGLKHHIERLEKQEIGT